MLFRQPVVTLSVLGLMLVTGCAKNDKPTTEEGMLIEQNFDQMAGWLGAKADGAPEATLTTAAAHSGRYAARVGNGIEYGVGFTSPIGELIRQRTKKLELSAWCYLTDRAGVSATIVFQIDRPANPQHLVWANLDLSKNVPEDKTWTKVTRVIDVPDSVAFTDEVRLYAWRATATSEVYFDDIQVRTLTE